MDQNRNPSTTSPQQVIPLLGRLSEVEEKVSAIIMRLDPITNHEVSNAEAKLSTTNTVTGRLAQLGDSLQYLLDHIEL